MGKRSLLLTKENCTCLQQAVMSEGCSNNLASYDATLAKTFHRMACMRTWLPDALRKLSLIPTSKVSCASPAESDHTDAPAQASHLPSLDHLILQNCCEVERIQLRLLDGVDVGHARSAAQGKGIRERSQNSFNKVWWVPLSQLSGSSWRLKVALPQHAVDTCAGSLCESTGCWNVAGKLSHLSSDL